MSDDGRPREITNELIAAFVRLARADFSVRLPRNFRRDTEDTLAMFVNLIAEELDRLVSEREAQRQKLEDGVNDLSEQFLRLAAGDFTVRAKRSGTGDPLDVLAYLLDNTAAEVGDAVAEIERQRRALEAIVESMVDGVLFLDAQGVLSRVNTAMAHMLDCEPSTLVGRSLGDVVTPDELSFAAKLPYKIRHAPVRGREVTFRSITGATVALSVNASPQMDASGELTGIVLVARDERELRHAQARLQLTDRLTTMGTLAAGVAHEINNPLAFLAGNLDFVAEELEALERGPLAPERVAELRRAVASSLTGTERVGEIVRDLKAFSRGDERSVARVDVNKLIDSALGMLRNEIRHRARLVKEYGAAPLVLANEARVMQVMLNLLQNAAQAIPTGNAEGNQIRISTGATSTGDAFVEIHDTGGGIADEILPRVFDAFFTTKPVGQGTGLGLSICHKVVTSLGGHIEAASRQGIGTTFRVTLPPADGQRATTVPPTPDSQRATTGARRRRILVVDDEPEVGESIGRMLGRDHDVVSVTSGELALRELAERAFDLVLCDVMMPEMSGVELYERLVDELEPLRARVVFMTGGTFGDARERVTSLPNPLIEKPFDREALRLIAEGDD